MTDLPVWDDGTWAGLQRLDADTTSDICVVGLGGSGLVAVDEALRLGKSVIGVADCNALVAHA